MKSGHVVVALVSGLILAVPNPLRAQELLSAGVRLEMRAEASEQLLPASPAASFPVPAPDPGAPPVSAAGALPAWPPDTGDIFRKFREDLSKPLTPGQKFERAIKQSFFPGILGSALAAGLGMAVDTRLDRDYGMGGMGFVRRWGSAFGENAVGLFVGDFALASAFHQDPRYHPDKKKGFGHRLGHALAAVVVTPSDSGRTEVSSSHLAGILVATGAATAWHHQSDRSARLFGERFGYDLGSSALRNFLSEFIFYRNEPRN